MLARRRTLPDDLWAYSLGFLSAHDLGTNVIRVSKHWRQLVRTRALIWRHVVVQLPHFTSSCVALLAAQRLPVQHFDSSWPMPDRVNLGHLQVLAGLPALQTLSFRLDVTEQAYTVQAYTVPSLRVLRTFPALTELNLNQSGDRRFSDADVAALSEVSWCCRSLDLAFCERLTHAAMPLLATMTRLERLNLAGLKCVTDATLECLRPLRHGRLRHLDLSFSLITHKGLAHLVDWPLIELVLKGVDISDEETFCLRRMPQLQRLCGMSILLFSLDHSYRAWVGLPLYDLAVTTSPEELEVLKHTVASHPRLKKLTVCGFNDDVTRQQFASWLQTHHPTVSLCYTT